MQTIMQTILKDGYFEDGMTVKIVKFDNGKFGVYYYIHCEGRHSEYGTYNTYEEALQDYEKLVVTYC